MITLEYQVLGPENLEKKGVSHAFHTKTNTPARTEKHLLPILWLMS